MSDEKSNKVIQLFPDSRQDLVKEMLTNAFEYVHANPDVQEAVLIISSKECISTFSTPLRDPFTFLALMEMIKYKTVMRTINDD